MSAACPRGFENLPSVKQAKYSLPFAKRPEIRRCTAPFHKVLPGGRHCIDFYMPVGTPVLAARDGVVTHRESRWNTAADTTVFSNSRKGNDVVICHDDGEYTVYAHVAWRSVRVRLGERVKRGQVIALSGQTGFASYPHLHFGIYAPDGRESIPARFREALPPKVSYRSYEGAGHGQGTVG
jgi:murein DD-endopeptidase MepM/ murein hydrolase activator NlpD